MGVHMNMKVAIIVAAIALLGGALAFSLIGAQPQGEKLVLYSNFAYYSQDLKLDGSNPQFELPYGVEQDSVNLRIVNGYVLSQRIIDANYTTDAGLLKSYVGKQVSIFDSNGKEINGTLLKFDGRAYVKAGNDLFVITPSYYQLPGFAGNITDTNASVIFKINATAGDARLSYLLDSISWSPDYTLYLDGDRGTISLYGAVDNYAKDYSNVSLSLFYGQVKRTSRGYYYPSYDYSKGMENSINTAAGSAPSAPSYTPSAVSEFYKFDLGNVDLEKGSSKFNLMERSVAQVKKTYEMGIGSYYSSTDPQPLTIELSMNNSVANGLGIALPAGNVRMIDADGFVGEDYIYDTTKGEEFKVSPGSAFDVVGTSRLVNETDSLIVSCDPRAMAAADAPLCAGENGSIYVSTYTYEANVKDKKDSSADIVLSYTPYGEWTIISETIQHEKVSQNLVKWKFTLNSNTERTVSFTIKVKTGRVYPYTYYEKGVAMPG